MRSWLGILLLLLFCQISKGQKKWDGEGGDAQWKNPLNWHPDGIPVTTDDVILDHTYLTDAFTVILLDTVTSNINSLQLLSNSSASIQLLIPVANTCSPALQLNTNAIGLLIGKNTILQNRSGATAGNSITLNGSMIIQDEGKYIHGTIRGNAALVSKLTATDIYRKGIFEFDVPGTSGYTLSLSGRQFPILALSSKSAGKKSYSGSGNSNCTVKGDLIVADSSSLSLSMNGNLLLGGNLRITGKFLWQPSASDIIGRELQFNGDSCQILNYGSLKLGANFRKLVVTAGRLNLNTPLRLDFQNQSFEVKSGSTLNLDTAYCSGPGWFRSDSLSFIYLGSSQGISDTTEGNIRMANLHLHPNTFFNFTSLSDQHTGIRFPEMISAMHLKKPNGELALSKSLVVTDSLVLNKGNILSSSTALLEFKGEKIGGSIESHIKGPLKRTGNLNGEIAFPIGDDSLYAPTTIHVRNTTGNEHSYIITYRASPPPPADSLKTYPIKNISKNEHWILEGSASDTDLIIQFPIGKNSLKEIKGQPNIVYFDSIQMKWSTIPSSINSQSPYTISTSLFQLKNGVYTMGEHDAIALPNEKIYLKWEKSNQEIQLKWHEIGEPIIHTFFVEISSSNSFNQKTTRISLPSNCKNYRMPPEIQHEVFARIKAILENGKILYSNTVRITPRINEQPVFPNPSMSRLYLKSQLDAVWVILQDGRKIRAKVIRATGNEFIDVSNYPPGIHLVLTDQDDSRKWQPFMKQ